MRQGPPGLLIHSPVGSDRRGVLSPYSHLVPCVTPEEAAEILNIGVPSVYALASAGTITPSTAVGPRAGLRPRRGRAALPWAPELPRRRAPLLALHVAEVAHHLRVHQSRVRQLLDAEKIPSVTAPNGRRYVRLHQLEVIANARDARAGRFG